ncbi:MAG: hypothetical protein IJP62_03485 [Treponema sp.]|nr:hypothetical protein [Treponema sp.]MBQ6780278.1 hypothetical protein [Treponema sp.]
MTIEDIVDALKGEIKEQLGFPAFLLPQKAVNNTAHIDLLFQDIAENGAGNEKLIFSAEYRTAGTHAKWLTETIRLKRKIVRMNESEAPYMTVTDMKFRSYWIRNGNAGWRYPSEDENSMPAEYVIPYLIEIDIPTRFLEE